MKPNTVIFGIVSTFIAGVLLIGLLLVLRAAEAMQIVVGLFFAAALFYGWVIYSFLYYRFIRQEELLSVLTTAADSQTPLAPALWAYVHDRPNNQMREFWSAFLLFFVLPGYYWFTYRRNNFDRRLERVAMRLESGYSLHDALCTVPGVASRETLLAAAVGEKTGQLDRCLRAVPRLRLAIIWFEAFPRIIYPFLVLSLILVVVTWHLIVIAPRFERIFADFGPSRMPALTKNLYATMRELGFEFGLLVGLGFLGVILIATLIACSATFRWHMPGVGWLSRMHLQSRGLKMLGILLDTGMPLPEALGILADSGYFGGPARQRWQLVREAVEAGEPFATPMQRQRLLPRSMMPLVEAAGRANNLPWALAELGEHLGKRAHRILERISLTVFPILIVITGVIVGAVALAFFLPMVNLISEMAQ